MDSSSTVNPVDTLLNPGSSSSIQGYGGYADQTADYEEPAASSSAAQEEVHEHQCPREGCDRSFRIARDLNKHLKTHNKPIKCKADKNCKTVKAEQRDMDRHYRTAHRDYAARKGILTEGVPCGFEGCKSKFSREDNRRKHWKKLHDYEPDS
ncbi:hypothetical protein ACJ41O_001981 [Fusarium nematophilum]